jgi:hypothetical protein
MRRRLVGRSLSLCVKDIIDGNVHIDDVEKIEAGTFYTDRDMFHVGMKMSYCHTYWRKSPEIAHDIAMRLYDDGRLHQPRLRGLPAPDTSDGVWRDA